MPHTVVRLRSRIVPVLVGVLLLVELLGLYRGWRVLLVGLGLAWLIGYLWARSLAKSLRLKREMRFGWLQVGDRLLERLTLTNSGRFPALWVEVDDRTTVPNHRHRRSFTVGKNDSFRWFNESICSIRGLFGLGPVTVRTGDPFGFYSVELEYSTRVPVLILPQVVTLPTITLAPGGRAEEGKIVLKSLERTVSAASVREYLPGDYHRWIHWPTTAKQDDLFVRVFDAAPAGDLWIMLDMCEEVQLGEGEHSTEEQAVVLAASLADRELRNGRAVGLLSAGSELVWLPPRGGELQRWHILHSLAIVSRGGRRLADLITRSSWALQRDSSLIVITPDAEPSWIEALAGLVHSGASATVMLLDRSSFGSEPDPEAVQIGLIELGVESHLITHDWLESGYPDDPTHKAGLLLEPAGRKPRDVWEVVI